MKEKILFLCTGNSCRSQMAEGLANYFLGDEVTAYSTGITPTEINPIAIEVMNEIGVDISGQSVNKPDDFKNVDFDYIITLCSHARETCPVYLTGGNIKRLHWGFPDPAKFTGSADEIKEGFRKVRDGIKNKIAVELANRIKTG